MSDQQGPQRGQRVFKFDLLSKLANSCPCWIVISSFDCRDFVPTQSFMEPSKLLDMFSAKALNRSTQVVGLLNSCRPMLSTMSHVPAAFFRPIESLLELTDAGVFYRPVTAEDLAAGVPPPHWCLPLHMQIEQLQTQSQQVHTLQPHTNLQALATAALSTCQWWCIVHKYQTSDAKCDFNWQSKDLVAGLVSRSVSPYTLALGLNVHKERSMPWMRSCLFMPVGAILHQHQCGIAYNPVTKEDLDTFNTLGLKGALQGNMSPTYPLQHTPSLGAHTHTISTTASGPASSTSLGPSLTFSNLPQSTGLTRGGSGPASITAYSPALQALSPVPFSSRRFSSGPAMTGSALFPSTTSPGPGAGSGGFGLAGFNLRPVSPTRHRSWSTPLFKLAMSAPPGQPSPAAPPNNVWWLLDPTTQQLQGPLTPEQLVVGYTRGQINDTMYVCGGYMAGMSDPGVAGGQESAMVPAIETFQPLRGLMVAMQQGLAYTLQPWPVLREPHVADTVPHTPALSQTTSRARRETDPFPLSPEASSTQLPHTLPSHTLMPQTLATHTFPTQGLQPQTLTQPSEQHELHPHTLTSQAFTAPQGLSPHTLAPELGTVAAQALGPQRLTQGPSDSLAAQLEALRLAQAAGSWALVPGAPRAPRGD